MAKSTMTPPFKSGRPELQGAGGGRFLSIKPDEHIEFSPMVGLNEMVSARMHEFWDVKPAVFHPCIGRGCPGCAAGNEPRFKGYLPVWQKENGFAIFPFTISIYKQLEELEDAIGQPLRGRVIRVKRNGSGLLTRYTVVNTGMSIDLDDEEIPDFIDQLGPATKADILDALGRAGILAGPDPKPAPAGSASSEDDDDNGWGDL